MKLLQLLIFSVFIIIANASSDNDTVFQRVSVTWDPEDKVQFYFIFEEVTTNNLGEVVPDNVTHWGRFRISVRPRPSDEEDKVILKKNCVTGIRNVTKIDFMRMVDEIEPGAFRDLPDLEELSLSYNSLRKIKKDTFAGLPISTLQLAANQISVLEPGAFHKLKNLKILMLYDNLLQEFSIDVLEHPSSLTHLNLGDNRLTNIESLANLTQLRYLSVSNNTISSLPKGLLQDMNKLEVFSASYNKISSIPHDLFKNTPNLEVVELSQNLLTTIPEGLFSNTKIERLDLSFNQISSIPLETFDIPTLGTLNLGSNNLKVWSSRFLKNTPNLQILDVSKNSVEALPDESFSSGIVDINFSQNKIVDVADGAFKKVGKMHHLNVDGNPFSEESLNRLARIQHPGAARI